LGGRGSRGWGRGERGVQTLVLGGAISKGVYSGGSGNTKTVRRHYYRILGT